MDGNQAVAMLMRVHYDHFMVDPQFWNRSFKSHPEHALFAADGIVCRLASDLRKDIQKGDTS